MNDAIAQYYQTGSTEVLGAIYTEYLPRLRAWSKYHLFVRESEFIDLYHDYWCHIQPNIERKMFDIHKSSFTTWFYHCWKRFVLDQRRRQKLEMSEREIMDITVAAQSTPYTELVAKERTQLIDEVGRAAMRMPVDEKIHEMLMIDASHEDIVDFTGMATRRLRLRICRYRKRARQILSIHPKRGLFN